MSVLQSLNNAILIIDDFLNVGRFSFAHLSNRIKVVTQLGAAIREIQNNPNGNDTIQIKESLESLVNKLYQLSEKMNRNWNVLKVNMLSESPLFGEASQEAGTILKFLMDVISQPCTDSIVIFENSCGKMSPLLSGYKLIALLDQEITNPLIKEMNGDDLKSTKTFEKWNGILDGVMTEFLFLESFSNGISWGQNMYGPDKLKQKIQRMVTKFDFWRDEHKINYWPTTVQNMIYRVQNQNVNYSNEEKAVKLKSLLNQVLTDDSFMVMVYDDCEGYRNHSYTSLDNQLISSLGMAGSNILVYRSKFWDRATPQLATQIIKEIEDCKEKARRWTTRLQDLPEYIMANHIQNIGLVGLIKTDNLLTVLSAHSEQTPGHFVEISIGDFTEKYFLIAGYK